MYHKYLDVVEVSCKDSADHGKCGLVTLKNTAGNVSVCFPFGPGSTRTAFYGHDQLINRGTVFDYFHLD